MGLFFGLLSARLLLARWRWAAALAGLAAGTAFAFKLTLVSAALSGLVWLLWSSALPARSSSSWPARP